MGAPAPEKIFANPEALDAAFDQVMKPHGSFDRYLQKGLRLSDSTLTVLGKNFLAE